MDGDFLPIATATFSCSRQPKIGSLGGKVSHNEPRLEQLCAEILNLYRQQLNALDKIAKLEDADLRQYGRRRRDRMAELLKELENFSK